MAVDAPKGLVPVRKLNGQPFNGAVTKFVVTSSDATAIYIGDIVKMTGASPSDGARVQGEDVAGLPIITKQTVSSSAMPVGIVGVVVGFKPDPDNLMRKHRAASTDRIAYVVTDPDVVFECQEDADTTPIVAASIGLNVSFAAGTGSDTTGVSGLELDSTTVSSATGHPFKLLGLSKKVDNTFYADQGNVNAKFDVAWNWPINWAGGSGNAGI